jgi:hypothetical protein
MTFEKAKQEFQIRYYLWSISEFEREINELFPNLRLFKTGSIWKLHQFMQQLDRNKQLVLAHSLLKRFHPDAVKTLGENCSEEENCLRDELDAFRRKSFGLEVEIPTRRRAGEKIKFVSKGKLRKIMVAKFREAYGSQCVKMEIGPEWDPLFDMKCCGWIISTQLFFGRHESLISYNHSIVSETRIHHPQNPEITASAMKLKQLISFSSWLGICSQTQWEYLMEVDVEPACDAAIKFCGHFFEVAPKLLKGLEFEKITAD